MRFLNCNNYHEAVDILKFGGLVAIPTETVYGLAANIFIEKALKNIFSAKGRPSDNPLIVHVSNFDMVFDLVRQVPEKMKVLTSKFWPGPLTVILPKTNKINNIVSGGLNTVAIRMPNHKIALKIIDKLGIPLAAPSANRSGSPSPTSAKHVYDDLNGRIDAVIDGGACQIGIESTVISFMENTPKILRPGAITYEMIKETIGEVKIDNAVCNEIKSDSAVSSPGMKYKHYSPNCNVVLVEGQKRKYIDFVNKKSGEGAYAFCHDEDIPYLDVPYISYGSENNLLEQSKNLFEKLRYCDVIGAKTVYAHCPSKAGIGLAIYNRLLRSAGFEVVKLD